MLFQLNVFDVVELNNKDKAIIKSIDSNRYYAEIITDHNSVNQFRYLCSKEITKILYTKKNLFKKKI